jgi:hypothetical protein
MDTLDERQGLSGERQDMSAAIIRISYALDEAGRLQPIEQANERNWPCALQQSRPSHRRREPEILSSPDPDRPA